MFEIKGATVKESKVAAMLFQQMWVTSSVEELEMGMIETITSKQGEIFIAYQDDEPVGVAQCGLRHDYVEGTHSSPVGYLEGIYVKVEYRHQDVAKQLAQTCEQWAIKMNCTEFASDCELHNLDSLAFHQAIGFTETNRIICFTKKLS